MLVFGAEARWRLWYGFGPCVLVTPAIEVVSFLLLLSVMALRPWRQAARRQIGVTAWQQVLLRRSMTR